ncbi:MAG TPA: selenium metabolism-associated LysR family transcriptional regulator [Pyrinomonadaceae bacterium]|nr:selenium metabolism-associated LysR family transcriptional regulator [Pyrinomonadaceae bacterium]
MEVRDLQVFISVARHLNYTRAGEEVHLSQPSVSIRIRQLETELGVRLFEQLGKKVALTDAGLLLMQYAQCVITAVQDAEQAIQDLQGLQHGSLRIGASTTPGMYIIPKTIARFKERYPKIEIHLGIKDTREIEAGVIRNEFDFGFVGGHLIGDAIDVLPWLLDELVLIVPPGHYLTRKKSVSKVDLEREQFVLRESGSATRATVIHHLEKSGLKLQTVMEMENPESLKKAVQSGLGIAFISKFAVESELKAKTLVTPRIPGFKISRDLKIVHRKDKHLSHAARTFIDMAK